MDTPSKNQARRYTVEEWEQMKPKIRDLIVNEKQKLKDVMKMIEKDLGFVVSEKQVKSRITKWGFDTKNVKGDAMLTMARMQAKRKHFDDKESAFRVNKQRVDSSKINRYMKRKEISESSLLDMASPIAAPSPAISVFTPRPDSPHSNVLCSPSVHSQQQFPLPLPSSSSRIAQRENIVELNDFFLRALPTQASSSQIQPICMHCLRSALQSPANDYGPNGREVDTFSGLDSGFFKLYYFNRYECQVPWPVIPMDSDEYFTAYDVIKAMEIWPLVTQVLSLIGPDVIARHAHEEAQEIVKTLMTEDSQLTTEDPQLTSWKLLPIFPTDRPLQMFWIRCIDETYRLACLRVLHRKFSGTVGPRVQSCSFAVRLLSALEGQWSYSQKSGCSVELFPLIVFSVQAGTQTNIAYVRARWEQLSKSHIRNLRYLPHYAGRTWAAAEEYWRQRSFEVSSETTQTFSGGFDAPRSHGVGREEEQPNSESLLRRLRQWIDIFERIVVQRRELRTDFRVPDGSWEFDRAKTIFEMNFIPK